MFNFSSKENISYKVPYNVENTEEHSKNVSIIALKIAEELKLDPVNARIVACAARYHDIGKKYISPDILNKPGNLNTAERKEIEKHARIGANLMKTNVHLRPYSNFVLLHHENYDGTGYNKVRGKNIPFESRIIRVADYYDALREIRPYREAKSQQEALQIMLDHKKIFDPEILQALVHLVQRGEIR